MNSIKEFYLLKQYLTAITSWLNQYNYPESQKLKYFKEDFELVQKNLEEKSSIQTLRKETVELAEKILLPRLYEIGLALGTSLQEDKNTTANSLKPLWVILNNIRGHFHQSFYHHNGFFNPNPSHILFSQAFHASTFSFKSGRQLVAGKHLKDIAQKLDDDKIRPDDLRIEVYLAEFKGKNYLFAYNNRTWVVYSQSEKMPSRVVPILPTRDLLSRIEMLIKMKHNPGFIRDEDVKFSKPLFSKLNHVDFLSESKDDQYRLTKGSNRRRGL